MESILRQAVHIYPQGHAGLVDAVGFGYVYFTIDGQSFGPDPELFDHSGNILPQDSYDIVYYDDPVLMVTSRKVQ